MACSSVCQMIFSREATCPHAVIKCEFLSCGTYKSKYSCPKCNINYCSVTCYQSENHLQCSETFYEHWVQEELKSCTTDSETKKRMLEILKQNQVTEDSDSLDSDDEEAIPDIASRLAGVDLNDEEAVWKKLTPEEQKDFKKLVSSGNILKLLPEWEPWWKTKKRKNLIKDCDEDFDWKSICPDVPSDIPELTNLTKTQPSHNVPLMLLNALMSYIVTVRWFKGAHQDMPLEGISTCIALSATLRSNEIFNSLIESFRAFENDLAECAWVKDIFDKNLILEDLNDIIKESNEGDFFCLKAAICDINLLCSQALIVIKETKTNHLKRFTGLPPKPSLLQQISRKMNYYLSWSVKHGSSLLDVISVFSQK